MRTGLSINDCVHVHAQCLRPCQQILQVCGNMRWTVAAQGLSLKELAEPPEDEPASMLATSGGVELAASSSAPTSAPVPVEGSQEHGVAMQMQTQGGNGGLDAAGTSKCAQHAQSHASRGGPASDLQRLSLMSLQRQVARAVGQLCLDAAGKQQLHRIAPRASRGSKPSASATSIWRRPTPPPSKAARCRCWRRNL